MKSIPEKTIIRSVFRMLLVFIAGEFAPYKARIGRVFNGAWANSRYPTQEALVCQEHE